MKMKELPLLVVWVWGLGLGYRYPGLFMGDS